MAEFSVVEPVFDAALLDWLRGRVADDVHTGLDAEGWPAAVWLLHPMYECRDLNDGRTHDDVHQQRLARGELRRDGVARGDLDSLGVLTGGGLGWSEPPSAPWKRLRWTDLAARLKITLGVQDVPPCFRWFSYRSWPASLLPPSEGSLDAMTMDRLLVHLAAQDARGMSTPCYAYYALAPMFDDRLTAFRGPLGSIPPLVDQSQGRVASPSNFWPEDRSWFVYTDWDLWATKVSGPTRLIQRLRNDPDLETLVWQPRDNQR
jgi:hypothetical protein